MKLTKKDKDFLLSHYRITANGGSVLLYGDSEKYAIHCSNGAHCELNGNLHNYIEECIAEMNFGEDNFSITEI